VLAAPGRPADLGAAETVCAAALAVRDGSAAPGWQVLATRCALIDGRRARLTSLATIMLDPAGNPVPEPRHHPVTPKRTRPLRFARTA
jgi:hypothetical protein